MRLLTTLTHRPSRALAALAALLALLMAGATALHAQRFQTTLGTTDPVGEEGNAVIETSTGDFVTAGVSTSGGATQIYLARTNGNGSLLWHYLYQLEVFNGGGATDIKEFPNGDFAVVGWAELYGWRVAMMMRIDPNGIPIWTRAAWINNANNVLTSVRIAQQGNGVTTNAGDIIFSGHTIPINSGTPDGILGRMDGNGNSIFYKSYDLPGVGGSKDDRFYGVDEAQFPAGNLNPGDIVAAGVSSNLKGAPNSEVWVVRADGADGTIFSSGLIGDAGDEIAYSIQELRNGSNPGDLAITGSSTSRPFPSTAREAFVLQMTGDPCDPNTIRAAEYYGDNGSDDDWGTSVKEITTPQVGNVGNIVIGGNTLASAFGGQDGFMQEFQEATLTPAGQYTLYGDGGNDEIHSITEAQIGINTTGYAFAGATPSSNLVAPGNGRNLWLAKNNKILENTCQYAPGNASDAAASWQVNCSSPSQQDDVVVAPYNNQAITPGWGDFQACYSPFKMVLPEVNDPMAPRRVSLASYPLPAVGGDDLYLAYTLASAGPAEITITDALGRVCYHHSLNASAGASVELVGTGGWSPGFYNARITAGDAAATAKIILSSR